jgi:hypothetical protein
MNLFDQRVIFSDNGVLKDLSPELNSYLSGVSVLPFVAAEDFLYIGTVWPWSTRHFEIGTANSAASNITVELWDSGDWFPAIDQFDMTALSGVSFAQSGQIRILKDRNHGWTNIEESNLIPGLAGTNIYDLYWARISFSADLSVGTTLKYIGAVFSDDNDLYRYFPDLNQAALKTLFKSGKVDWKEQGFDAAKVILKDLKDRGFIASQDQILDPNAYMEASVYKTAQLIYGGLGKAYSELMDAAAKRYTAEMNLRAPYLDITKDGQLSRAERQTSYGRLVR